MADTIQEGVAWQLSGDPSDLLSAFDKVNAGAKGALQQAQQGADLATKALEAFGTKAGTAGTAVSRAFDTAAHSATAFQNRLLDVGNKYNDLINKANNFKTTAQNHFQAGRNTSVEDLTLGGGLQSAGSKLGLLGIVAGFAYEQVDVYNKISVAAAKAKISAQELEGVQSIFKSIGADGSKAADIMGAFASALAKAKTEGGDFADLLSASNVKLVDQAGHARSNIAVFADFAKSIKDTGDADAQLQAATQAVGAELAGPLVDAIKKSNTGLGDLASTARDAGGVFTNDLAAGAHAAAQAIDGIAVAANGAYAQ